MELATFIVIGLVMGIIFGFALEKSKVFAPAVILRQLTLQNFIMLKLMGSIILTGMVAILLMNLFGDQPLHVKTTHFGYNAIGGVILGIGIALAGACPGTVLAQVGAGYSDSRLTLLGALCGALCFGTFKDQILSVLPGSDLGKVTIMSQFDISFLSVAAVVVPLGLIGLFILEKRRSWKDEANEGMD